MTSVHLLSPKGSSPSFSCTNGGSVEEKPTFLSAVELGDTPAGEPHNVVNIQIEYIYIHTKYLEISFKFYI